MKKKIKLKLKRKIILKRKVTPSAEEIAEPRAKLVRYKAFIKELRDNKPQHEPGIVRAWWEDVYVGAYPPWDKQPQELVKLNLMYELIRLGYEADSIPIPPKLQRNIIASREFNIEELTPNLRVVVRVKVNQEQKQTPTGLNINKPAVPNKGGTQMPKTQLKETKTETIMRVLAQNETLKQSDTKLAQLISQAHPGKKRYTEADVRICRSKYNSGQNWGMTKPPKQRSLCYDKGKAKIAQPKAKAEKVAPKAKKKIILKRKKK